MGHCKVQYIIFFHLKFYHDLCVPNMGQWDATGRVGVFMHWLYFLVKFLWNKDRFGKLCVIEARGRHLTYVFIEFMESIYYLCPGTQ